MALRLLIDPNSVAEFCRRWRITRLDLFGSALREDFRPDSDVDVLVSFARGVVPTLADLLQMEDELAALFQRRVDLVKRELVEQSKNYLLRDHILRHREPLYVA